MVTLLVMHLPLASCVAGRRPIGTDGGSLLLYSPGKARHDDHNLAIYEAAGFMDAEAAQAATTIFTFVLGHALGPAATASLTRKLSRDGGDPEQLMRDSMAGSPRLPAPSRHGGASWRAARRS
jgi:hypothetical protein